MNNMHDNQIQYWLDFDDNGVLMLSQHNAQFINAIVKIDSNYRKSFDINDESSAAFYIHHHSQDFVCNEHVIFEICKRIDKENSTHLYVSGNQPGDNQGAELVASGLSVMNDLPERLRNGDCQLVCDISSLVPGQNKFSFATKFCANMCENLFDGEIADNYARYDQYVAKILPYYAWKFMVRDEVYVSIGRTHYNSTIESVFKDTRNYQGYKTLIDEIRVLAAREYKTTPLTRAEFDTLVWYYYKGANKEIENALRLTVN